MPAVDVPDSHYKGPVSPAVEKITGGVEGLRSTNPKDRIGIKKPPIHLIPAVASIHEAMAFGDGAKKYGPYNWRSESVSASIYIAALYRHIMSWYDGEDYAQDSGVHHLGHARACLAIILDAASVGKLVDDRPSAGQAAILLSGFSESEKESKATDYIKVGVEGIKELADKVEAIALLEKERDNNEHEQGQQSEGASHRTDRR